MNKVFISVGMSGRSDEEVIIDLDRAVGKIMDLFGEDEVKCISNFGDIGPEDANRLWYLGHAIQRLGLCNICYFTKGWQNYKGCKAEYEICKLYGIEILEES